MDMSDLWFEASDGASMDQEKATLLEFRHLLDDARNARLLGSDQPILSLAKALRQVDHLVRGRTDVTFRFKKMGGWRSLQPVCFFPNGRDRIFNGWAALLKGGHR
ncbi:hypothetical protein [Rhizobium leguminosarum]|uniref:hypothetical protein n=1 Tax=Rhizobium leguminosarum TaxID=384 RepID=UPI0013DD83B9|nr:hypothetical protein [Rhizobium leguminosarum]